MAFIADYLFLENSLYDPISQIFIIPGINFLFLYDCVQVILSHYLRLIFLSKLNMQHNSIGQILI